MALKISAMRVKFLKRLRAGARAVKPGIRLNKFGKNFGGIKKHK